MNSSCFRISHDGYLRQWHLVGDRRHPELIPLFPFSSATLWRMVKRGDFPKPYKLSKNVTAWRASEVSAWMESMASE